MDKYFNNLHSIAKVPLKLDDENSESNACSKANLFTKFTSLSLYTDNPVDNQVFTAIY